MKLAYKILRALIVILLAMAVTVPAVVYVGVTLPPVQRGLCRVASAELSGLLGAEVEIGSLSVAPFNRALLRDVSVRLAGECDTVMSIDRLGAGVNLYELAVNRRVVVNYVELVGLDARLRVDSVTGRLNIQPVIDRLAGGNKDSSKCDVDLSIYTVLLRGCRVAYDVDSVPAPPPGRFSPQHVRIADLSADLQLPAVGRDSTTVRIKRFKAREASGLEITDLTADVELTPASLSWRGVSLSMPGTLIGIDNGSVDNPSRLPLDSLLRSARLSVALEPWSYITPSGFEPLAPQLAVYDTPVRVEASLSGCIDDAVDARAHLYTDTKDIDMRLDGRVSHPADSLSRSIDRLKVYGHLRSEALRAVVGHNPRACAILDAADAIAVSLDGSADCARAQADLTLVTEGCGSLELTASALNPFSSHPRIDADINIDRVPAGLIGGVSRLGLFSGTVSASGVPAGARSRGEVHIDIDRLDFNGHRLGDIAATASLSGGGAWTFNVTSGDPAARFDIDADGTWTPGRATLTLASRFDYLDLEELMPGSKYSDYTLMFRSHADLSASSIDNVTGWASVHDVQLDNTNGGSAISLNGVKVTAAGDAADGTRVLRLESDVVSATVKGHAYPSTVAAQLRELALQSLPALAGAAPPPTGANARRRATTPPPANDFRYNITIHDTERWAEVVKLPVSMLGDGVIDGTVDYPARSMDMTLDARYLRQGNKLIEGTRLDARVDGSTGHTGLDLTTVVPTKHGGMTVNLGVGAVSDTISTRASWVIDRAARYDGTLSVDAVLDRLAADNAVQASVVINPGRLTFNDSTWTVSRATVDVSPDLVLVNGINVYRSGQYVKIDGRASRQPDDEIKVDLLGVNLDYIFESLGIDKVMLGGDATGRFYASSLFSPEPHLTTPGLNVRDISYNKVVLGDALVRSHWDMDRRAVTLDAVIDQPNGRQTLIDGAIFPLNDSIDITFDAHDVDVAFMYPYMSAFASSVGGRASGKLRLWGNFKYIDMEGDVKGDNIKIGIAFTNTSYTTSDNIRLRLGEITLDNMLIKDCYGNTARLNGKVWHKFFKEPVFDFTVADARNLLVYDESQSMNPDWYGRIFGNGSAHVDGRPGVVNIGVRMATAPGSTFTFVLNDMEEASDYTFITFRDRDRLSGVEVEQVVDDVPGTVKRLREMLDRPADQSTSAYNIDLTVDINPDARINLIMDPTAGDNIRSNGTGNLRLTYGSADNDLHMYGTYTLDRGNYLFTLQDIIIKDFIIKPGSSISFTGDPFSAQLDIRAAYALTANLTDLDESFLQDKDLNRTTVPVNAILKVTNSLQQPDIGFDLEFPTLNQDTYRKVRSIVSTEDMMNRQIIYLLALNRFYTPDYMSATRGNELVSVASSTISSQLGNILGNISDKWNIAPNFRSDRGDFSDLEVDVALSSSLLNNRLLFNGNLGYRDKSLNNTQFVGDFDIEYLLNRKGTLRLKAYNRYNDMNYYVRTAETTQGVGISLRHNFDSLRGIVKSLNRRRQPLAPADTTSVTP